MKITDATALIRTPLIEWARSQSWCDLGSGSGTFTFIDVPEVDEQNQPTVDRGEMTAILQQAEQPYCTLYALLAGCGPMRAGEALGLDIRSIHKDFRTLEIVQKAKRGELQDHMKTKNADSRHARVVDLSESLAAMLRECVGGRTSGLVFCKPDGSQLMQRDILKHSLHPILKKLELEQGGFNIFRRFRITELETAEVPAALQHTWSGHAKSAKQLVSIDFFTVPTIRFQVLYLLVVLAHTGSRKGIALCYAGARMRFWRRTMLLRVARVFSNEAGVGAETTRVVFWEESAPALRAEADYAAGVLRGGISVVFGV